MSLIFISLEIIELHTVVNLNILTDFEQEHVFHCRTILQVGRTDFIMC